MHECLLICPIIFWSQCMWGKKTGGGITTLSGDNTAECDLGSGENCRGAVRLQQFWGEGPEAYSGGQRAGPESPERRTR